MGAPDFRVGGRAGAFLADELGSGCRRRRGRTIPGRRADDRRNCLKCRGCSSKRFERGRRRAAQGGRGRSSPASSDPGAGGGRWPAASRGRRRTPRGAGPGRSANRQQRCYTRIVVDQSDCDVAHAPAEGVRCSELHPNPMLVGIVHRGNERSDCFQTVRIVQSPANQALQPVVIAIERAETVKALAPFLGRRRRFLPLSLGSLFRRHAHAAAQQP